MVCNRYNREKEAETADTSSVMWRIHCVVFILLSVFTNCCYCQEVAVDILETGCPDITGLASSFGYDPALSGNAVLTFKNDLSLFYQLEVNVSIPYQARLERFSVTLRTSEDDIRKGKPLIYDVYLSSSVQLPKFYITIFNNRLFICNDATPKNSEILSRRVRTIIKPLIVAVKNDEQCGENKDSEQLIIQGTKTKSGEYPWLVAMFYLRDYVYFFTCAGSLISNLHVITAAHCTRFPTGQDVKPSEMLMVLGRHNIINWALDSTIVGVDNYIRHPEYAFNNSADADLALITMKRTVTYSPTIKPICLWDEKDDIESLVRDRGVIAGWGRDETGKNTVDEAIQVTMPIVADATCLRSDIRFFKLTSSRTFCAGDRNGSSPCTGDSGGGFVMKRGQRWKLRGVVSTALLDQSTSTCDSTNYVIFTDVPKYHDWLKKAME